MKIPKGLRMVLWPLIASKGALDSVMLEKLTYAYANARVKGMKTNLVSQQQMDDMLSARNVSEIVGLLGHTGYRDDLTGPSVKYSGAKLVEIALGQNLSRTFARIMKFTPSKGREMIGALVDSWDVHNIKTILLARSQGESNENVEPFLVMAGSLGEGAIVRLLKHGSVKEVVDGLRGTRYYEPLASVYKEYEAGGEVLVLLNALDSFHYSTLATRIVANGKHERIIEGLVKAEVDAKNVMNILRSKKAGMKPEQIKALLFDGGSLYRPELERMAEAEKIQDAVAGLKRRYDLSEAYEKYARDGSLTHFEVELEREIVERGLRSLRMSVLSVGAIASFIFLKEREVGNIRKIVHGVEFGLPAEEIREMVVRMGG